MADDVKDNPVKHRFELIVDGVTAFAEYERKPGVVVFTHTVVPDALGGKGVGARLAKGALDAVRREGAKVVPQCPFIAKYIEKHTE